MAQTTGHCLQRIEQEPYMSRYQRQYFQNRLLHWRNELCLSLKLADYPVVADEDKRADWIDAASVQTQTELSWAERERSLQIVKEIDAALKRIRDESYGFCIETGEEIGIRRLIALPIARLSVEAQQQRELLARHYR